MKHNNLKIKKERLEVRVSKKEKEIITDLCRYYGMSQSDLLRYLVHLDYEKQKNYLNTDKQDNE